MIWLVVIGGIVVIVLLVIFAGSPSAEARLKQIEDRYKELESRGFLEELILVHFEGLPVPGDTEILIQIGKDSVVFSSDGMEATLDRGKITDVSKVTETELHERRQSMNLTGAIVGGALFGGVGAIIGSRPKTKTTEITKQFLVFSYKDENDFKSIVFEAPQSVLGITTIKTKDGEHIPIQTEIQEIFKTQEKKTISL